MVLFDIKNPGRGKKGRQSKGKCQQPWIQKEWRDVRGKTYLERIHLSTSSIKCKHTLKHIGYTFKFGNTTYLFHATFISPPHTRTV